MPNQKYPGSEDSGLDHLHKLAAGLISNPATNGSSQEPSAPKKRRPGPYDHNPIRMARLAQKRAAAEAADKNARETEKNK